MDFNEHKITPPRWARRFFRWYCHPKLVERIEGDLFEEYDDRAKRIGKRKADISFIKDVMLLFRPRIIRPLEGHKKINTYGMYKSYLKVSWRNILKSKVHSIINMGGLSIGMAAAMLIVLYLKDEYRYDTFHENALNTHRIVVDWINPDGSKKDQSGITGYFQGPKFKEAIPEITESVRWIEERHTIKMDNELQDVACFATDSSFFNVFTFPLLDGDSRTALQKPKSVIITESKAIAHFNTLQAVGKTIDFKEGNEFVPYEVTGVAKTIPSNSSIHFDYLLPLQVNADDYVNNENWFNFFLNTFVVLHPSADPRVVEQKMMQVYESDAAATIKQMAQAYDVREKANYGLQPLTAMHLSEVYKAENGLRDASNPMYGYILSGIALFILLIACINFVNLSIARSLKRAKEIGVRKVVGGNRSSLAVQFMSESYLMCFFAFALSVVLVQLALPLFNQLAQKSIRFTEMIDITVLVSFVLLFLVTGFIAGIYPALVLSGFNPSRILYSRFRLSGNNTFQKSLVVVQFALAAFLIMATLTIYSQFDFMTNTDLGYDDHNLLRIDRHSITHAEYETFKNAVLQHPGVAGIAPKNGGEWGTVARVNGEEEIHFNYNVVDEAYSPLMKIQVLQGRNFSPEFPSDADNVILINEAFAKKAEWKDPIGQQVNFWYRNNKKYTVVGVVKNHHFNSLNVEIMPQLFVMKPDENFGRLMIRLSGSNNSEALTHIEKTFKKQFPNYTYTYKFIEDDNREMYQLEARWKQIVLMGSVLTVFISCIGLFGLASLTAERRTKEIGVRKILGASVNDITRLLSINFVKLVVIAFAVALPAAYMAADKWLSTYAYRVDFSIATAAITLGLTVVIAFTVVGIQGVRAGLTNPVNSLRSE